MSDDALREALLMLRPREREALMLRAWFDLSPTEAATALGISPSAFRMRLSRARRQVREALEAGPVTEEEPRWNLI